MVKISRTSDWLASPAWHGARCRRHFRCVFFLARRLGSIFPCGCGVPLPLRAEARAFFLEALARACALQKRWFWPKTAHAADRSGGTAWAPGALRWGCRVYTHGAHCRRESHDQKHTIKFRPELNQRSQHRYPRRPATVNPSRKNLFFSEKYFCDKYI